MNYPQEFEQQTFDGWALGAGGNHMDKAQAQLFKDELQGARIGGWDITGSFGNGKSAVVMRGVKDDQVAALKVFHPELIERYGKDVQLERIRRESSLVGANHPNLVQIYGGGECPVTGHLYVAMEALPYGNLRERLGQIPLNTVSAIISQVASAARFLEDRGLAHRDIKPENIAVSDDLSRAVLLDLGVLRPVGISGLTDVDQRPFIGTLQYSSPEFLLRKEADTLEGWRAVTFYQLGAVLHDLLTGKPIFEQYCEPFSELVEAVKSVNPIITSEDARLASLAKKCLLKNPNTRLELVSWPDFSESPAEAQSVVSIRDRLKDRQKLASALRPEKVINPTETDRIATQLLKDLCNRLESRIAALMNDAGCFPLRSTRSFFSEAEKSFLTVVEYDKDMNLGLPFILTVCLRVQLIDANEGGKPIFRADSHAFLTTERPNLDQLPAGERFFAGEAQDLLDSAALEEQFMVSLERYYEFVDRGTALEEGSRASLVIQTKASDGNV